MMEKMYTIPEHFVKIAQRIRFCGAFVFRNSVKFSFLGPTFALMVRRIAYGGRKTSKSP